MKYEPPQKGAIFNKLIFLGKDEIRSVTQKPRYLFKCECGNITSQPLWEVRRGNVVSCGCYHREIQFKKQGEASINAYYTVYVRAAQSRDHTFELTKSKFLNIVRQDCHYCGSKPKPYNKYYLRTGPVKVRNKQLAGDTAIKRAWIDVNGIDRKDNEKGYILKNVVPCCTICNHAKYNLSYEDFLIYLNNLVKFRSAK